MPGGLDPDAIPGGAPIQGDPYLAEVQRTLETVQMGLDSERIAREEAEARCSRLEQQLLQLQGHGRPAQATPLITTTPTNSEQTAQPTDPFAAIGTPATTGTPFDLRGRVARPESNDAWQGTPTPQRAEPLAPAAQAGEHRQRRHASFEVPMSEVKSAAPRRSEILYVPLFDHHAPKSFDFRETTPSEVNEYASESTSFADDLASFATRS